MDVRILTLVTNLASGEGPGHSAIAVGRWAYTFEDIGGWADSSSGWKTIKYDSYLAENTHRPVLVQKIQGASPSRAWWYVKRSAAKDDDYLSSGVCSQQVAEAVDYALGAPINFDPKGFDTPFGVYHCARRLGIVQEEEYAWPGRDKLHPLVWARIINKLRADYPLAFAALDGSP